MKTYKSICKTKPLYSILFPLDCFSQVIAIVKLHSISCHFSCKEKILKLMDASIKFLKKSFYKRCLTLQT